MTISALARTSLPLGLCPAGTPLGSKLVGTINLCALGDSITADIIDTPPDGWRYPLHQMAAASGLTINWIGNQISPGGTVPANVHRASVGKTLADHMQFGAFDSVTYLGGLSTLPDVLIHHLGTNDIGDGTLTANYGSNLTTFIGQLNAIRNFRHVVVLIPARSTGNTVVDQRIDTINAAILSSVGALASGGRLICTADCRVLCGTPGYGGAHYGEAGGIYVHPKSDGYIFEAAGIWPAFLNATGRAAVWPGDPAG